MSREAIIYLKNRAIPAWYIDMRDLSPEETRRVAPTIQHAAQCNREHPGHRGYGWREMYGRVVFITFPSLTEKRRFKREIEDVLGEAFGRRLSHDAPIRRRLERLRRKYT